MSKRKHSEPSNSELAQHFELSVADVAAIREGRDIETGIYALYFDADGNGPTALELKPDDFSNMPIPMGIGLQFTMVDGEINLNDAPIEAGLYFSDRPSLERLHAYIGAWLTAHPETPEP